MNRFILVLLNCIGISLVSFTQNVKPYKNVVGYEIDTSLLYSNEKSKPDLEFLDFPKWNIVQNDYEDTIIIDGKTHYILEGDLILSPRELMFIKL